MIAINCQVKYAKQFEVFLVIFVSEDVVSKSWYDMLVNIQVYNIHFLKLRSSIFHFEYKTVLKSNV